MGVLLNAERAQGARLQAVSSIFRLSKFQEYLPIYEGDRYCLMCGQACPVRRVTKNEATSPHGWALLVASVNRGLLTWNDEAVDILYQCADCGHCQGNCATDRPLPYALMAARAQVIESGHTPASVKLLEEKFQTWGNPYGEKTDDGGRTTEHIESSVLRQEPAPSEAEGASVALFIGDSAHFMRPQTIAAAEKLLRAVGVTPHLVRVGYSNGYLPYTLGLWDTARKLAQELADELRGNTPSLLITLSAQDAHTFKHVYPELGITLPDTLNITTLVDYFAQASMGERLTLRPRAPQPYTYHDATQSIRLKGYALHARVLATEVMGGAPREMVFRENLATPVGNSGGLAFTHPALAENMARTRIREANETGAEILLTDDLMDTVTLEKYADGIQVLNLFEVMAKQVVESRQ